MFAGRVPRSEQSRDLVEHGIPMASYSLVPIEASSSVSIASMMSFSQLSLPLIADRLIESIDGVLRRARVT